MKLPSQCEVPRPPCSPAEACPKLTGAGTLTGTDSHTANCYDRQAGYLLCTGKLSPLSTSQGIDWCSKQARRTQTAISTLVAAIIPPFFFLLSSPRPVHMVIIIIPPKLPTLWSLSSPTPPTSQDGQATAWFARRLFVGLCAVIAIAIPLEVPDSTRLDRTWIRHRPRHRSDPICT